MSQKVAYVTGGMGGIGTAICRRLHKEGFKVIAGCGPTRDAQKWLDEQKADGYTFYASVGNVSDWQSTTDAFTKAKAEHGPIDVLVGGRYFDRYERRDDKWKFLHRAIVTDWANVHAPSIIDRDHPFLAGSKMGQPGPTDPSYDFFRLLKRGG